jgi:peptidoglycan lytic transglycosylase
VRTHAAKPVHPGWTETGIASWYGVPYDGRRTASGEVFDMRALTAAHRTLPFDTWVEVTNLTNGERVDVRINDRGPFVRGRILDLSLGAAGRIGMVREGTARVRLKVIDPRSVPGAVSQAAPAAPGYAVQAGVFSDRKHADTLCRELRFPDARVVPAKGSAGAVAAPDGVNNIPDPDAGHTAPLWRVLVGRNLSQAEAQALAARIRKSGNDALVVKDVE